MRQIVQTCGTFVIAATLGAIAGKKIRKLQEDGHLRVHGMDRLKAYVQEGGKIIAPNHPSLIEAVLLPALFWPEGVRGQRLFPWSVPDRTYFPWYVPDLSSWGHCVTVDRKASDRAGAAKIVRLLESGQTVIIHDEGGRSTTEVDRTTLKPVELIELNGRKIRRFKGKVVRYAMMANAEVIPVWINIPCAWEGHNGFLEVIRQTIRRGETIELFIGEPFKVNQNAGENTRQTRMLETRRLEQVVLGT